ncbi:MAG: hypothetical protein JO194_10675, partial [Candidatus Eremiobacteraeota bacterium]|nr:hypothetical protein [Candidatus Eremiobacteraeota bacterium]
MNLELLNVFATLGTFVVISATAIAALVQLRHARSSNQIAAMTRRDHLQDQRRPQLLREYGTAHPDGCSRSRYRCRHVGFDRVEQLGRNAAIHRDL